MKTTDSISIFNYLDYRVYLNDELFRRINKNPSYSLRAYARDLDVSVGFLSDILRGQKKLSPAKGKKLFTKFNLSSNEIEYVLKLVIYQKTEASTKKESIFTDIWSSYKKAGFKADPSKKLQNFNVVHFIVYGLIRNIKEKSLLLSLTQQLGFETSLTNKIIQELLDGKYIYCENDSLCIYDKGLIFADSNETLDLVSQFSKIISSSIKHNGGLRAPESVAHAFIFGLDKKSYDLAVETHKHYLKSLLKISSENKMIEKIFFVSDLSFTLDVKSLLP